MTTSSRHTSHMTRVIPAIAAALLLLGTCMPGAVALSTISDWVTGFATFYGGAPDGMVRLQAPVLIGTWLVRARICVPIDCSANLSSLLCFYVTHPCFIAGPQQSQLRHQRGMRLNHYTAALKFASCRAKNPLPPRM